MQPKFRERVAEVMSRQTSNAQLNYALQHFEWLEKYDENPSYLRSLGFQIINAYAKHFDSPFFNDERILRVSMTVGRLSRNLGIKTVMQQIYDRGQFQQLAEFYVNWAELHAAESNYEQFERIYSFGVQKKAEPRSRFEEAFSSMRKKYFSNQMEPAEEETQQLFGLLRSDLRISEDNKENVNVQSPLALGGTSCTQSFFKTPMQNITVTLPVAPPRAVQTASNSGTVQGNDNILIAEPATSANFQDYVDEKMDIDHKAEEVQKEEKVENRNPKKYECKREIVGHVRSTENAIPKPQSFVSAAPMPKTTQSFEVNATSAHQPFHINHDFSLQEERSNEPEVILPWGSKGKASEARYAGSAKGEASRVADSKGDFRPAARPSLGGSLLNAVNGLTLGGDGDDDDKPTGRGLKTTIQSEINPWDEKVRQKIMNRNRVNPIYLHDCAARMNRINTGMATVFEGEKFDILEKIGEGGFAKVFKCYWEDRGTYALKVESPSCRWEVYLCELLHVRLPVWLLPGIMTVDSAYIYSNMSCIVYEYHRFGSLLDMANSLNTIRSTCSGLLTVYLSWEMARILKEVHAAKIIHGDVKPDNFMVLKKLDENSTAEELLNEKCFTIKLIDWGRAIDMSALPGRTFTGRAGTECFDCFEMMDGRPWTYNTDFFGFMATMHVLLFGQYIKTTKDERTKQYSLLSVIKRRCNQRDVLQDVFQRCMNIPDCDHMPDWTTIITGLAESVRHSMNNDRMEWKTCAREFNQAINSQARK